MNARPIVRYVPLLLLSFVAASGCRAAVDDTPPPDASIAAATAPVRSADVPATFEAGGIVRARTTALVASRILAPVSAVHVRAGDRVRRGTPLVTLDGREIAANQARAAAALAGSVEAVRAAEGSVRAAEAALALARTTHERMQALHEKRSATTDERDRAVAGLEAADGQLQSARASLAVAAAARQAAAAGHDAASAVASYTTLTAPFDGTVAERHGDPGDMASPGVPLLTLEDEAGRYLDVILDDTRAGNVAPGRPAEVFLGGDGGEPSWMRATVREVERMDAAAHSFLVTLDLPAGTTIRTGTFGRARFAGALRRTLVMPAAAAIRRGQLTFTFVVDAAARARLQPISLGASVGDSVEVLSGLTEGARVVVAPPPSLSEGMRIDETRP